MRRIEIFFELADPAGRASLDVRFLAKHEREHGPEEACGCGGIGVDCVASGEWPCLYHGVLELSEGRLGRGREHDLGTLRFPCEAGTVTRAYLVCGYETKRETAWELPQAVDASLPRGLGARESRPR